MTAKKLMVLGGSAFQEPLIQKAKEMGLYVITCDYLPDNPGHVLADEYHNASTTDPEAVLAVAQQCGIDAITTFCSDPAVPAVAFVAEAMGLPGPTLSAVEQLTEKDKFRQAMQAAGLNTPEVYVLDSAVVPDTINYEKRYIVKPVDSSGSKGITRSAGTEEALSSAIEYALEFSRAGRCIIESFIDGPQVHGDAFILNGKVVYHYLGDHYFYTDTNSFIPISTRWPASISPEVTESIMSQVELIADYVGYRDGPINIEARIDSSGEAYIIEVGPRNGGNFVPIIQQRLSGFDFTEAVIAISLGNEIKTTCFDQYKAGAHYILHAAVEGVFSGVAMPEVLQDSLFYQYLFKTSGETVSPYTGSNQTIGICLFEGDKISLDENLLKQPPSVIINKCAG
jgi:biotin carboxylase